MTLLTIINNAQDQLGLPRSASVMASTDQTTRTLRALSNVEGQSLQQRANWQNLNLETVHTALAQIDQGPLSTVMPGYKFMLGNTIWDRTLNIPIYGPLEPPQWQALVSMVVTGPYVGYRIWGDHLWMYPAPTAGDEIAMEYASKNWCQSSGGTPQSAWAADSDTGKLDENLMTLGLVWRFQQSKGFAYADNKDMYETQVLQAIAREASRSTLNIGEYDGYWPTAIAPQGNWPVT